MQMSFEQQSPFFAIRLSIEVNTFSCYFSLRFQRLCSLVYLWVSWLWLSHVSRVFPFHWEVQPVPQQHHWRPVPFRRVCALLLPPPTPCRAFAFSHKEHVCTQITSFFVSFKESCHRNISCRVRQQQLAEHKQIRACEKQQIWDTLLNTSCLQRSHKTLLCCTTRQRCAVTFP